MRPFFEELQRRNVFRVAAAYLVAAWLVLQVLDVLTPILSIPDWVPRTVLYLLILGFFVAVVLSWVYELTEKGIERDEDVDSTRLSRHFGGRKLDFVIIALLSVAVAFMVLDKYVRWDLEPSVAVLPFADLSEDNEASVFVDGMHSGIVARLSKLRSLDKVIGTDSVENFRNTDEPIAEIASRLDVATIVTGDVYRAADHIRVNVHLVNASDNTEIWAETYERELNVRNLFTLQTDVARNVAAGLHLVLSSEEDEQLEFEGTNSLEAYEEWLRGKSELVNPTEQRVNRAYEHFENAIELDPDYVLAWVGVTEALNAQRGIKGHFAAFSVHDQWLEAVENALKIDPLSMEAILSLATLKVETVQFQAAEELILKAMELSPHHAPIYALYSGLLRASGRLEEANWASEKSLELEPIPSANTLSHRAWTYLFMGDHEQVEATAIRGLRDTPDFFSFYAAVWWINNDRGNYLKALRWAEEGIKYAPPSHPWLPNGKCRAMIGLDMPERARQCLEEYESQFGVAPEIRNFIAYLEGDFEFVVGRLRMALDDPDQPLWLRQAVCGALVAAGRPDLAWPHVLDLRPDWTGDTAVNFGNVNYEQLVAATYLLYTNGRVERANYLFDGMLHELAKYPRAQVPHTIDVVIHFLRGDFDKAASALRDAIDKQVYPRWWIYRSPLFDGMRADPELNALLEEVEAEIVRQREWYEENRDKPLFE